VELLEQEELTNIIFTETILQRVWIIPFFIKNQDDLRASSTTGG
jgi:hypothetical protein